jgi:uncharacterized protein (TIGR02466 family)
MLYKRYFTSEVYSIFPTPLYYSNLNRDFNSTELKFVDKSKKNTHENEGNLISDNNYILNEKPFAELKYQIELRIHDYFNKIICTSNNLKPYITQSWISYTEEGRYHHKHSHSNSLVSGVMYITCNEKTDSIVFFKDNPYSSVKPETKTYNLWNSDSWKVSVKTGDILMFPSSLTHMVDIKKGKDTRISLAFNVFVKGTLGDNRKLSELIL